MEADFTQYYQADLRELWRPGSGMTLRWVIAHLMELPDESRIKKHFGGEKAIFSYTDHLIADVRDLLITSNYFAGITATKDIGRSKVRQVADGVPKRPRRPGEEEEEKRFATPEELSMLFPRKALERRRQRKAQKQMIGG